MLFRSPRQSLFMRHGLTDFDAELVTVSRLAFADAFHLRCMQRVELVLVSLVFGHRFAETTEKHLLRSAASLWADVKARDDLVAPTCLFAMMYLRYMAEESDSWDETKDHESQATRESELIRDTSSGAFAALAVEKPGKRWSVLQTLLDAEDANRLLLARELTIEEKREFVDLAIDAWLRSLPVALSRSLRSEWSVLRELDEADLTLRAIRQLIDNERLRGSQGA